MLNSYCRRGYLFFFQAEDGIRDIGVTGVQTCALPIYLADDVVVGEADRDDRVEALLGQLGQQLDAVGGVLVGAEFLELARSEERRVGKECRSRWSPYH